MVLVLAFIFYKSGLFSSAEKFRQFILQFGIWAPIVFILIQNILVVVPFIPSAVTMVAGVMIFGTWVGFLYSYIGICCGSILAFIISRKFGGYVVKGFIGEKNYNKYIQWLDKGKKFDVIFAIAILSPISPDNLLCFIAGLSHMKFKKFLIIILLGKPISIFLYSMGFTAIFKYLVELIF